MSNKNILTIQTVQIAPFRTLMTALKDILLETNITFTKEGIKIINMDKSHTILAHLSLVGILVGTSLIPKSICFFISAVHPSFYCSS